MLELFFVVFLFDFDFGMVEFCVLIVFWFEVECECVEVVYVFVCDVYVGVMCKSGEFYIIYLVVVVIIFVWFGMDIDSLMVGLLYDMVEDVEGVIFEVIEWNFGFDVCCIVEGEIKVSKFFK